MKSKLNLIWLLLLGLAFNPLAYADEEGMDADEDTMEVVEEGQTEEEVVEFVEHESPNESAQFGTDVSNMARNPDRDQMLADEGYDNFGQWVSEKAHDRNDMRDQARRDARAEARGENGQGNRP